MSQQYFKNRDEAGRQLAEIVFHPYGRSNSIVLALNPSALLVARPIALRLQISLYMVATKEIDLPGSFHERVGTVDQSGDFVYNSQLTQGQIDDYIGEYHNHIESEKMNAMHEINAMMSGTGFVNAQTLQHRTILLVSDGFKTTVELDAIMAFLKPVDYQRLVCLVPVASIDAIDRLHILTDEIRVLSPKENYLETTHYYEENRVPDREEVQTILRAMSQNPFAKP